MSGAIYSAVCDSSASLMITVSPGSILESSQGYTEAENGFTITSQINCNDGEVLLCIFIPFYSLSFILHSFYATLKTTQPNTKHFASNSSIYLMHTWNFD